MAGFCIRTCEISGSTMKSQNLVSVVVAAVVITIIIVVTYCYYYLTLKKEICI
jgi:hypothetical protein